MIKNFFKSGIGSSVTQCLNILCLPLVTRLYTPNTFSVYVLFMALTYIVGSISCLRYELAIVLPKKDNMASYLFYNCIIICFCVSIIIFAFINLFFDFNDINSTSLNYSIIFYLSPISIFLFGVNQVFNYWSIRKGEFLIISICLISNTLITLLSQIFFGYFNGITDIGLVVGTIFGQIFGLALWLILISIKNMLPVFDIRSINLYKYLLLKYSNFPKFSTPYVFLGTIRSRASLYIISYFLSPQAVSFYSLSYRFLNAPANLISSGIRPVIYKEIVTKGVKEMEYEINKIIRFLILLSTPFLVILFFYSVPIFTFLFGDEWSDSGNYVLFFIIPFFTFLISNWMDRLVDVLGKQKMIMKLEIVFCFLSLFTLWLLLYLQFDFKVALYGQSIIFTLYNIMYILIVYLLANYSIKSLKIHIYLFFSSILFYCLILKFVETMFIFIL